MTQIAENLAVRCESRVASVIKGKYRLDALIGIGGMAAVYAATHRNGDRVALKVLHTELSIDDDIRRRFLREGYVANRVEHPGAVRVIDDDVAEDGAIFLVLELLEGETLARRFARRGHPLSPREVVTMAHQLLDVLIAAHDKGIVHRDLKPENLFLTMSGTLKVLDFGIARLREGAQIAATPHGLLYARTERMLGTPAFMPPEQALGRSHAIDARTDLWGVGATMFTLLSGEPVHSANTPEELLVYAATRPARSLAEVAPELPRPLVALVDTALSFAKSDRFRDARAMSVALEAANDAVFHVSLPPLPRAIASTPPAPDPALADTFEAHGSIADSMRGAWSEPMQRAAASAGSTGAPSSRPRTMASRHKWKLVAGSLPPVSAAVVPESRPAPARPGRRRSGWAFAVAGLAGVILAAGALVTESRVIGVPSSAAGGASPGAPRLSVDASIGDASDASTKSGR